MLKIQSTSNMNIGFNLDHIVAIGPHNSISGSHERPASIFHCLPGSDRGGGGGIRSNERR